MQLPLQPRVPPYSASDGGAVGVLLVRLQAGVVCEVVAATLVNASCTHSLPTCPTLLDLLKGSSGDVVHHHRHHHYHHHPSSLPGSALVQMTAAVMGLEVLLMYYVFM